MTAQHTCRCDSELWRRIEEGDPPRCAVCGGQLPIALPDVTREPVTAPILPSPSAMDYRTLLKRYMHHVIVIDGTAFIDSINYDFELTPTERAELEKIHEEILNEHNR